ncbi:MAG: hypothetical protein KIT81_01525 [Alphaproteobacteria bacterium]|nr:hypothetical protein [Alphaproteobacteria bacterium]
MRVDAISCSDGMFGRRLAARVTFEDGPTGSHDLEFTIDQMPGYSAAAGDVLAAACFPLAVHHGEKRMQIDAEVCPRLRDGLAEIHALWRSWSLAGSAVPAIEARRGSPAQRLPVSRPRQGCFLSGGVDSLHMLWRNLQDFAQGDPGRFSHGYIVHGFDIGKKPGRPQQGRFGRARAALLAIAAETDLELVSAASNIRRIPVRPDFWLYQQHGGALAAIAHLASTGNLRVSLAATQDARSLRPNGSHPLLDPCYSSEGVQIRHWGLRFSRLDKLRELRAWPTAFRHLRVCPSAYSEELNCGDCEKCIRTRLELLAIGVEGTEALGGSLVPPEAIAAAVQIESPFQAACYRDLLEPLAAQGHRRIVAAIRQELGRFEGRNRRRRAAA